MRVHPAIWSLQPEAIAAGKEVTNYLKPAIERAAVAGPASMQVVTRVNGEQTFIAAVKVLK